MRVVSGSCLWHMSDERIGQIYHQAPALDSFAGAREPRESFVPDSWRLAPVSSQQMACGAAQTRHLPAAAISKVRLLASGVTVSC